VYSDIRKKKGEKKLKIQKIVFKKKNTKLTLITIVLKNFILFIHDIIYIILSSS